MFKLPVVKFFSRLVNRVTVTFLLILIELGWMLSVYRRLSDHLTWLNAAMTLLSAVIILFLVRRDENPAYTIAWMALIGLTPVFGGLMYLLWGNKRPSRRMRRRMAAVVPKKKELSGYLKRYAALVSSGAKGAILNV